MLILETCRTSAIDLLPTRLFFRHKDAEAYEQIGSPSEEVSYESPVTCSSLPIVIFNSIKWNRSRHGGEWEGVYSFNLNTKELAICVSREKLRFSDPHGRMWISELISISEDAGTLYVNVAIEKEVTGGTIVNYFLATIGLPDQQLELLSPLKDIRY